jgi:hypothetical protein
MFAMHQYALRLLCRGAFCLACAVPTLLVAMWCVERIRPGGEKRLAAVFSQQLGLRVTIEGVCRTRPHQMNLIGVWVSDPETGAPAFSAGRIRVTHRRNGCVADVVDGTIHGNGLPLLNEVVRHRLLRPAQPRRETFELRADRLRLIDDEADMEFQQVNARLASAAVGPRASVQFTSGFSDDANTVQLQLTRNLELPTPMTEFEVKSQTGELPAEITVLWQTHVDRLGQPRERLADMAERQANRTN